MANNNIKNVPYTGVSTGWGWGRYDVENITRGQFGDDEGNKGYNSPTVIKNNIVFSNRISNYANKLGDTGGVYNLGASPGMRIVGNLISNGHTPGGGTHFVNGVYLDNGSRGIEVEYNGVYDVVNNNYFYNGNGRYNTLGKNNEFHHLDPDDRNISDKLKATAGQQSTITKPRSVAQIIAAMPKELEPEPLETMPEFGFLVGKTATASVNSDTAVNTIDGNPRTYWDAGKGNTSGSLVIDTGANNEFLSFVVAFGKVIDGVETYVRSGMTYQMDVSKDGKNWRNVVTRTEPTFGRAALPHYFDNTIARYIRLNVTDSSGQDFGVLRFKAYTPNNVNNATNMAWNGTAKQSSTWQGSEARLANDGSTIGNWKGGEVTHTDLGSQNYWEVDLGGVKEIGEIRIWNRTDCCTKRLRDYHVFVSDTPIVGRTVAEVQAQKGIFDYHEPGVAGTTTDIPVDRTGRYVRVQLSNTDATDKENVMSLAEVQVYRR